MSHAVTLNVVKSSGQLHFSRNRQRNVRCVQIASEYESGPLQTTVPRIKYRARLSRVFYQRVVTWKPKIWKIDDTERWRNSLSFKSHETSNGERGLPGMKSDSVNPRDKWGQTWPLRIDYIFNLYPWYRGACLASDVVRSDGVLFVYSRICWSFKGPRCFCRFWCSRLLIPAGLKPSRKQKDRTTYYM